MEQALDDDWDMIPTLTAFAKTREFCRDLESRRQSLEVLISRHLGISSTEFVLLGQENWVWGSFNICLPIDIKPSNRKSTLPRQAILRFPLPFRCGEDYSPGNVEEKLRCEAATYIWLQQNCPTIPIPRLLAIGIPATESVRCNAEDTAPSYAFLTFFAHSSQLSSRSLCGTEYSGNFGAAFHGFKAKL